VINYTLPCISQTVAKIIQPYSLGLRQAMAASLLILGCAAIASSDV